jgi:hypothetical protein
MKEEKEKKKRGGSNKDMRGMDQVKEKKNKVKEGCHVVERRNFHSFSCAIRQRGRHRCLVVTIFFFPCTCPPF